MTEEEVTEVVADNGSACAQMVLLAMSFFAR